MPEAADLRLSELAKPGAGESSDTRLFTIRWSEAGEERELAAVLRCAPSEEGPFPEYDLGMQHQVMQTLGRQSIVPVPEMLWLEEDPAVIGVPFLVMRSLDAEAPLDFPPLSR